jgi:hypothetical protein
MKFEKYIPLITGFFVFIVYLFTLAPSVVQIDSGELSAVQVLAGIAHPTGYPLFTITGFLWSLIPLPVTYILKMNIFAAFLCSIAAGLFVKISFFIFDNIDSFKSVSTKNLKVKKKQKEKVTVQVKTSGIYIVIASIAAALMLAFSKTFWFQSTSVEVYSMHLTLLMMIIYFLLKAYVKGGEKTNDIHWIIFSLVLALGFANHMTTLLILPGTAYLYFIKYRFNKNSFIRLGIMISVFALLLVALYSYLPLRASANPVLNWGNPVDLEKILRHISGKQYQVWLFSSSESAKKQLEYFITNLPYEFTFSLLIAFAGIFLTSGYSKKLLLFFVISFIATVGYSINYEINDIDSYFLLAYVSLAFLAMFAAVRIFTYFYPDGKGYKTGIFVASIFILLQFYINIKDVNQSGNYAFEDYTKSMLGGIPQDAIIFGYQWDYMISPAYYFQFVENFRKDVAVIDKELLRRSWYYNQLQRSYPDLFDGLETELDQFKKALVPFERDEKFDPNLLENLYRSIMTGLVRNNSGKREFFITPELVENELQKGEFTLPEGYSLVPDNLAFRVVNGKEYVPASDPDFKIRLPERRNHYIDFIEKIAGSMLARRAFYEMQFDKRERAAVYIKKLKEEFPGYPLPPQLAAAFN